MFWHIVNTASNPDHIQPAATMFEYIVNNPDRILMAATSVVTIASILTSATETPKPETLLGKIYRILEVLALVIGKAKQK